MELTNNEIKADIQAFEDRITEARHKLSELPVGPLSFIKAKARDKQTRDLQNDIKHYQKIIGYAEEALENG